MKVADNPFIGTDVFKCPKCGSDLKPALRQKLVYPPLSVVECSECKVEYWRECAVEPNPSKYPKYPY